MAVKKLLEGLQKRVWRIWYRFAPARKLVVINGDSLPGRLPVSDLVLARDGDEDWCVGMRCPCGCGRVIELLVFPEARPNWKISVSKKGHPSLHPSIWLQDGCRSHFWVREGKVVWS